MSAFPSAVVSAPSPWKGAGRGEGLIWAANSSWVTAGNLTYAASQWAVLAVLARLGDPAMVGQYCLAIAIATPLFALANLQLSGILVADVEHEVGFREYLRVRLSTSAVALAILAVVAWILRSSPAMAAVLLAIGTTKALDAVSEICYGLFQQQERMNRHAGGLVVNGLVSGAAVTAALVLTGDVVMAALGGAVGSAVSLVVNLRHAMASTLPLGGEGRVRGFRRLLALTPHTALAAAFSALAAGTPRYFIGHFWGASALGVFGALSYTLMPGTILTGAMSQAAAPQLARACQRGHHHTVRALAGRLASIAIVMGMGGFTLAWARGEEILLLLYGPAYAGQKHLLLWLILAGIAGNLSSIAAYTAAATRAHARLTVPYLALAVVAAGSSAALVPAYGLVGAAWAGLATSLCGLLIPAFAFRGRRKAHA